MNIDIIFPYDYIILLIIALILLFSFLKGFVQSFLGLLTWIGSILITIYTYNTLSDFISKELLKIDIFKNYDYLMGVASIIVSIPILFFISYFILKRIRRFLSSDLDKKILGILFDKLFGILYGLIFSYVILSTVLFLFDKFELTNLDIWLKNNSNIIVVIDNINNKYFYNLENINNF